MSVDEESPGPEHALSRRPFGSRSELLLGLDRKGAAEFSFLIAVPVLFAASGYELIKMRDQLALDDTIALAIGFVVSFVVALAAVKGFVTFLSHGKLVPFAWYRIVVAPIFYLLTRGVSF